MVYCTEYENVLMQKLIISCDEEGLTMILVLQNTATIILYANYNKTGFLQFSIRKVIPAPSGTVKVHVGFPRKYPRTDLTQGITTG